MQPIEHVTNMYKQPKLYSCTRRIYIRFSVSRVARSSNGTPVTHTKVVCPHLWQIVHLGTWFFCIHLLQILNSPQKSTFVFINLCPTLPFSSSTTETTRMLASGIGSSFLLKRLGPFPQNLTSCHCQWRAIWSLNSFAVIMDPSLCLDRMEVNLSSVVGGLLRMRTLCWELAGDHSATAFRRAVFIGSVRPRVHMIIRFPLWAHLTPLIGFSAKSCFS